MLELHPNHAISCFFTVCYKCNIQGLRTNSISFPATSISGHKPLLHRVTYFTTCDVPCHQDLYHLHHQDEDLAMAHLDLCHLHLDLCLHLVLHHLDEVHLSMAQVGLAVRDDLARLGDLAVLDDLAHLDDLEDLDDLAHLDDLEDLDVLAGLNGRPIVDLSTREDLSS